MEEQLLDQSYRKKIIAEIKADENVQRKVKSYKKHNMQQDNFYQYVKEHLECKLDPETVRELDIFHSINLQKRVSTAQGAIYRRPPKRAVFANDKHLEFMNDVYEDIDINTKMRQANVSYKYQDQCRIQYYVEDQKIKARVLLPYQYDIISDPSNPEKAMATVISNFDNTSRDRIRQEYKNNGFSQGETYRDSVNQDIADYDDQSLAKERFYFWSDSYNFITNGRGEIVSKVTDEVIEGEIEEVEVLSPLHEYQIQPFVEVSGPKNFEYWCRTGDVLFDTTVMYNVILTYEKHVVDMQGHAQAYYKGDEENMPQSLRVGVDKLLFIPVNADRPVNAEFGFANPGSDLAGIKEFRESFLKSFLSSIGLDTSVISGDSSVQNATSGVEKMLQMIEKFETSQDDLSLFKHVEMESLDVIAAYMKAYAGQTIDGVPLLSNVYQERLPEIDELKLRLEYSKPEMVLTHAERIDIAVKEIEAGLNSRVHAIMELKGLSKEEAVQFIEEVDEFEGVTDGKPTENFQE